MRVAGQLQGGDGLSGSPPRPVPPSKRARGGADGRARLRRPSGSDGDGDVQALLDKERSRRLAPGVAEGRDKAEEKGRERRSTSTHGVAVYPCSGEVPRALLPGEGDGFIGRAQKGEGVG
jgi:hypothetical protein